MYTYFQGLIVQPKDGYCKIKNANTETIHHSQSPLTGWITRFITRLIFREEFKNVISLDVIGEVIYLTNSSNEPAITLSIP